MPAVVSKSSSALPVAVRWRRIVVGALSVGLLVGCAWSRPYRSDLEENLSIRPRTESGSIFSSVRANLDVYRLDDQCRVHYEGTVDLSGPTVDIGLAVDRPSYLVFGFASSSWLSNTKGRVTCDTVLTPRAGRKYEVGVSYLDDMYRVEVVERLAGRRGSRVVERRSKGTCNGSA